VDYGTDRDVEQRQVVAGLDVSTGTCLNDVTLGQLVRGDDVALGAINVVQEGDASRAVRIVLDFGNAGVDAVLVVATEVDQTVLALVATTLVTGGGPPFLGSGRTNDFSGVDRVISVKSATLEPRRPGVVGLYLRIPIIHFLVKVVSATRADRRRCRSCLL
jgi:hypothetical protein